MGRKKTGKRAADAPPTWHAKSKAWRKRLTVNGKQREWRWKFPNTAQGGKAAAVAWAKELHVLEAENAEQDRQDLIEAGPPPGGGVSLPRPERPAPRRRHP